MKKLLLLCLVLLGGVMQVSAQITESGKIKVYFNNPNSTWGQSKFKIFIKDCTKPDTWPGEDVTSNVATINGVTYYYREVDISTHGSSFSAVFVNCDENNAYLSQTTDVTGIKGDSFYTLLDTWTSGNRNWTKTFQYYFTKTDGTKTILMNTTDRTTWGLTYNNNGSNLYFVIANSYAFGENGAIDWDNQKNNICRNYPDTELGFSNVSNSSGIHNGWNNGSFYLSAEATYDLSVTFDAANSITPSSYSVSPYFTRTIKDHGYSTFASDYAVAIPTDVTASYATGVTTNNELSLTNFANGIPAGTGALLYKDGGGNVTFTPATSTDEVSGNKFVRGNGAVAQTKDGNTNYILTTSTVSGTKTVGFYKANKDGSNTVASTKAYLSLPTGLIHAREYFSLWEENTTSISSINKTVNTENIYYNINGQRVKNPTKGLYIVNGKKVIIK